MHRLLPADLRRRIVSLATAAAGPAAILAALVMAGPAQASPVHPDSGSGKLSIVIDSMSPQTARPGSTVTVIGTVRNGTGQTQAGLDVQLWTSPDRFQTRDAMDGYADHGSDASLGQAGSPFFIAASLPPGATVVWHASFEVNTVGIIQFGVYPVSAQLSDGQGDVLAVDQTLLPFWPGQQAAGLARPLDLAWTWPLIDAPHRQVCSALTNNDLAASLAPGGRLAALLGAGQAHPGADLTWVIDPALLSDVNTMTKAYQVNSGLNCDGSPSVPASKVATTWLATLRTVISGPTTVITPYANVDVSALVHSRLTGDITSAYKMGYAVADSVLHGTFGPTIAVPAGGTADLSVLTNLATAQGLNAVVLDSNEMPPENPDVFEDDAVTSIRTADDLNMTVLLADHTLTGVLAAGDTSSGVLSQSTQFAVSQRFLAETAMIAAEAPDSERSVVVEPPEGWSPSAALAGELLTETTHTPWLTPTTLSSLGAAPDSEKTIKRHYPPSSHDSPGELSASYLSTVSQARSALEEYQSLLDSPSSSYLEPFNQALIATESSAWRGGGEGEGLALARKLSGFISGEEHRITIIAAQQVPMGGSSGPVPVSIENGSHHAIKVRVIASVENVPGRASELTVGKFQNLVTVQPQNSWTVRLPVSSAPIGPTAIQLSLATANGKLLPLKTVTITVESTRYGRTILFLIGAAIGVLVLTSVFRGFRRRMQPDHQVGPEDADLPGSVVTGTSARHPTEAPDDLADARRWADDA